jgi:hypothetical protein
MGFNLVRSVRARSGKEVIHDTDGMGDVCLGETLLVGERCGMARKLFAVWHVLIGSVTDVRGQVRRSKARKYSGHGRVMLGWLGRVAGWSGRGADRSGKEMFKAWR